jgi:hypothetical protein
MEALEQSVERAQLIAVYSADNHNQNADVEGVKALACRWATSLILRRQR